MSDGFCGVWPALPLICHLNVRSLTKKIDEVHTMITEKCIDIMALSETWLSTDHTVVPPTGYQMLRQDLTSHSGGVCLYLRNHYNTNRIPALCHRSKTLEVLTVSIKAKKSLLLTVVYRHPKATKADLASLDGIMRTMALTGKMMLLLGDFNCDMGKEQRDTHTTSLCDSLAELGLHQLITAPTRTTRTSSTIIDLVITNSKRHIMAHGVQPCSISDHDIIYAVLRAKLPKPARVNITFRPVKKMDKAAYIQHLIDQDWSKCTYSNDTNMAVDAFTTIMREAIEKHCPLKTVSVTPKPPAPWLSDEIREIMRQRELAKKRAQVTGLTVHWDIYRDLRNAVNSDIKDSKRLHYNDRLSQATTSKEKWRVINEILGRKPAKTAPDDQPEAEKLNSYFAGICTADTNTLPPVDIPATPSRPPLTLKSITENDVISTIYHLADKPSEGVDGINTALLKLSLPATLPSITHIINLSLQTGNFPELWKRALVVPIYKRKGASTDPCNYRPIALLPILSKVTEKIVAKQLFQYMETHNILARQQHAFRKQHSTETALLEVTDRMWKAMDDQMVTTDILIDLSKAFDKVDHGRLTSKLSQYGITPTWFSSYLDGRQQAVRSSMLHRTSFINTTCVVPQGSCLGPVLFSLYTNDLPGRLQSEITTFAEDTQIISSYKPADQACAVALLQRDLNTVETWMSNNSLTINGSKTQVLTCGTAQQLAKVSEPIANSLTLCGETPQQLPSVTNLGVIFDETLSWQPHITKMCKRVTGALAQIGRVRYQLLPSDLMNCVQATALSHLHYCSNVWGTASSQRLDRVQRVMRMAGKVTGVKLPPISSLLETKLCQLSTRARQARSSAYINNALIRNARQHTIKPRTRTTRGQNRIAFRCA